MNSLAGISASTLRLPLTERLLQPTQSAAVGTGLAVGEGAASQPGTFSQLLTGGVKNVNAMQQDATSQINELLTGGDVNQAEVFTAVQKADMAFRMLVQVRNKLMSAYEELNNIRI